MTLPAVRFLRDGAKLRAFSPGSEQHYFAELVRDPPSGTRPVYRLSSIDRKTLAVRAIAELEELARGSLAVSDTYAWSVVDGKSGGLRRIDLRTGEVKPVLSVLSARVLADRNGAYVLRGESALRADVVFVPNAGAELRVLASNQDVDTNILNERPNEIVFWAKGRVVVPKDGSAPPRSIGGGGGDVELYQDGRAFQYTQRGLTEIDPRTGATVKTLAPASSQRLVGVLPGGAAYVEEDNRKAAAFGPAGSSIYRLHWFDFAADAKRPLFEMRDGAYSGGGFASGRLAWASETEIGELG